MGDPDTERFARLDALQRDPYPLYARARAAEGLTFVRELDAWLVARQAEVRAVLRDPAAFSSANALRPDVVPSPRAMAEFTKAPGGGPVVLTSDGDTHRRLREPLTQGLSAPRVDAAVPFVTRRAGALVEGLAGEGRADLMQRYARRLPVEVIAELLGLGPEAVPDVIDGSRSAERLVLRPMDEDGQLSAVADICALKHLLNDELDRRDAADPGDDLPGRLLAAIGTGAAARGNVVSNLQNLVLAGHLTTTALIGTAVLHLMRHRDQWELLCQRPELVPAAVEEAARYDAPIQGFRRILTRPVTLAGTELEEGAELFVAYGSANRDEAVYRRAGEFDITREPQRHLGFGHGAHACPGSRLAREQVRITLETLVRRLPGLRLEPGAPVTMAPTLIHRAPEALPLIWDGH